MKATGLKENEVDAVKNEVYAGLPPAVQPLFEHWVEN